MAQRKIAERAGHETGRSARKEITMAIKKEKLSSDQAESRQQATLTENFKNFYFIIPQMKNITRFLLYSVIFCNEFCNKYTAIIQKVSNSLTNIKPLPGLQIEGMGDTKGRN